MEITAQATRLPPRGPPTPLPCPITQLTEQREALAPALMAVFAPSQACPMFDRFGVRKIPGELAVWREIAGEETREEGKR